MNNLASSETKRTLPGTNRAGKGQLGRTGMEDRDAKFRAMYDAHSRCVLNFHARFLRNDADAEDAFNETFRRAYRGLGSYRGEGSEKAWLMKIATNVALRTKAQKQRHQHLSLEGLIQDTGQELASRSNPERLVLDSIEAEQLLSSLEPRRRAAVWMRVGLQMTDGEVAEALDVPIGTVKSWVWRSLAKLRTICEMEAV